MRKEKEVSGKKILWIEDDYYHLKGLVKPLRDTGFDVIPARSVVEAKSLLRKWQSFQLIILDLIIPYSDNELAMSDSEPIPDDRNGIFFKNVSVLVRNGLVLFDYMVEDLKVNIPILILSIVHADHIMKDLRRRGAVRTVKKEALLPKEVRDMILEVIRDSSQPSKDAHSIEES